MKIKKYSECELEFNNLEKIQVISSNYDEKQIRELVKKHFLNLESCNSDYKEMLKNDIDNFEIKKYYVPLYNVECMVNDDYRVSFEEEGNAVVHVVCGNNEARIDEESIEGLIKEEVVRFEGDYHFCSTDYKGPFANRLVHLDLNSLRQEEGNVDNINIVDRFISSKVLNKLISDKVTQAFLNQGHNQAKKYIAARHDKAKLVNCIQNTKIIDTKKTMYLLPIYEIIVSFAEENYSSYIAGVDSMMDFDYPRGKAFIDYNKRTRRNHSIRFILTSLMFVLLAASGIFASMFLNQNYMWFNHNHLMISSVGISLIMLVLLILYLLKSKRFRQRKDLILAKFEGSKKRPKSLYLISLIVIGVIDVICIALITTIITLIF